MPRGGIWCKPAERTVPVSNRHNSTRTLWRGVEKSSIDPENNSCGRYYGHRRNWRKLGQYGLLCQLYVEASCELTRRSKLSQEEAVRACKVYKPYIREVLQQVDMAITIFVMEKQLRGLKGRGHFPIPTITPHGARIETPYHINKFLE